MAETRIGFHTKLGRVVLGAGGYFPAYGMLSMWFH